MRVRRVAGYLAMALLALWALAGCQAMLAPLESSAEEDLESTPQTPLIRLAVCWEAQPLVSALEAAYARENPDAALDVTSTTSEAALELMRAGQVDLAIISRLPGQEEVPIRGVGTVGDLRPRLVALNPLGVIVAREWPLDRISREELAALYAGEYVDWAALEAGSGRPEFVTREAGAVPRALFEERIMQGRAISSAAVVMPHDQAILDYVAEHPGAVGYISAAYLDERVKLVPLDGLLPGRAIVQGGRYPLTEPLVILSPANASRAVQRLVTLALSTRGCRQIEQDYVCPR